MINIIAWLLIPVIVVTYKPGGETADQAMKRLNGVEVMGGGYYANAKGVRHSIDLVIVEGKTVIPYRKDLRRPVLVIDKGGNVRIDRNYQPSKEDWYAVAGASIPADRYSYRARQLVVLDPTPKFVKLNGTHKQVAKKLSGKNFIYMDGGSSVSPNARLPSHIVRLR
jgi:hypothetical protein